MRHLTSLNDVSLNDVWLTIGSFDGVHLGHQSIIKKLTIGSLASNVPSVVLTFHPHPSEVIRKRNGSFYLTTPDERASLLGTLGVDYVVTYPFDHETAKLSPKEFMHEVVHHLHPSQLIVGHDFALGRNRLGNVDELRNLGKTFGFSVTVLQPVKNHDQIISSSKIRSALSDGDVPYVKQLLGRPYHISGNVIPGDGRGKLIGIPTANIDVWEGKALPRRGVYACYVSSVNQQWNSVVNIGFRPTFDNHLEKPLVEAHLLNFKGNLYQQQLEINFIARLRDETQFPTVDSLVDQIRKDIIQASTIL